jgi:exopolyphosphatase/guanosine-5'-triphosphate,3'-diphosphate pyrophosphatase
VKITNYAGIDVGSNAIRLLLMAALDYEGKTHYKKVSLVRVPIRLGQDVFTDGRITDRNADRLVSSMTAFEDLMKAHEVEHFRACATSAMRDASNGTEIADQIRKESGIELDIISGKEEAEIIYSTHIENILDKKKNYLYIDVGGGSTEMTLFVGGKAVSMKSFNIGTIRLLNGLVEDTDWDEMKTWLKKHRVEFKNLEAIGSGGNINRIYKMNFKTNWQPLYRDELVDSTDVIKSMIYEERLIKLNMNIDRADVVIHAANIFLKVTKWAKIRKIHVPKMGLADGLIRQMHENRRSL